MRSQSGRIPGKSHQKKKRQREIYIPWKKVKIKKKGGGQEMLKISSMEDKESREAWSSI